MLRKRHSPGVFRLSLLSVAAATIVSILLIVPQASTPASAADPGETTFLSKCAACHTIGGGKLVGPDLKGVDSRRDHAWLLNIITAPDQLIASGDPAMKELQTTYPLAMPNLGISKPDAEAILSYIDARSSVAPATPAGVPAAQQAATGDPAFGQGYFAGGRRFTAGGPPCSSCHAIDGPNGVSGGSLGPNLTQIHTRMGGDAGLAAALAGLPFPTMMPIYAGRQPTLQEQADLLAYLRASAATAGTAPSDLERYGIPAVIGAGVLFALAGFLWRRRLHGVHTAFVRRATRTR
jgi:mono/diheme cytochrome c family protein